MPRSSFRSLLSSIVVVVLLAVPAPTVWARGQVTGRVVGPDGRAVAGARVLLSGDTVGLRTVQTDADGRFSLDAPDEGRLTIRVAADGFRAEPLALDGSPAPRDAGVIALTISALSESVVVSAAQVEVPMTEVTSSVTVIGAAEIEARGLHSVADALRTVPGLTLASAGGLGTTTGVFPRGGESNYSLVLVDGVPVNAFGGDVDFGHLSTAGVERIEVVRGPQSALYGANAIGSVIRIVSRRGGPPSVRLLAEGGHYGTSRLGATTSGQRGAFEWGGSYDQLRSDGMNGERTAAGEPIVNDDYRRRAGAASAGWRHGSAWVRGDVRYATDRRGFPGPFGSNPIDAFGGVDDVSRGHNERTTASVAMAVPVSARVRGQAQGGYSRLDSDFVSPFGASDAFSRRWAGRGQVDIRIGPAIDASAGIELQRERAGSTYITGAGGPIPIARTIAGYFGETRWNARDRVFVNAGLRIEDIRRDGIDASPDPFSPRPALDADRVVSVNPRLSAAWLARGGASAHTKLRGGIGTGIRPPDAFELAYTDNPGLRPERSISVEAGVDQAFASGLGLIEATAFANEYDDLIIAVGSFQEASRYLTDNISNARARGLEVALTLRGRLPYAKGVDLAARVGYTWLDTEILAVDRSGSAPPPFSAGQPLPRRPTRQFAADLTAGAGPLVLFVRGGGRSRSLDVEPSLGTFGGLFDLEGHHVWSAGASWRLGRAAEIFGRVENLFDRAYEEALGFPALGRRATMGLRIAAGG